MGASGSAARQWLHANIFARYWRGEYSLVTSYWIIGPAVTIIAVIVLMAGKYPVMDPRDYNPGLSFSIAALSWATVVVLSIWQVGGIWRSATCHIDNARKTGRPAPWAKLAKFTTVASLFGLVAQLSVAGVPQLSELARMAFLDDPRLPAYSVRIMRDGSEIEISGGIKYGVAGDLARILRHAPVRVVHLDSLGGRLGEAHKLHDLIKKRGLETFVSGQCLSACTLAFAGGSKRWLGSNARLGFHAPDFPGMAQFDLNRAIAAQRAVYEGAGFDAAFIDQGLSTPHDRMWTPAMKELLRSGVVTDIADGRTFAVSGLGGILTEQQLAAKLMERLPVLGKIAHQHPQAYDAIISDAFEAYLMNEPVVTFNAVIRRTLFPIVQRQRPFASDSVLVDTGKLIAAQYAALGKKDPHLCYLYVSGTGGDRNFTSDLPLELVQKEVALSDRILETSVTPVQVRQQDTGDLWIELVGRIVKRVEPQDLKFMQNMNPAPENYGDFCHVWTVFFDEISKMETEQAALLMREILKAGQGAK